MNIPGIYKISYGNAATLRIKFHEIFLQDKNKAYKITVHNFWKDVKFLGFPSVSESSVVENGQTIYNVELTWFSTEPYLFTRAVFKIEDVNGNVFLIGSNIKPYTRMTRTYTDNGPVNKKGYTYKIVYKNVHGLINIMP